MFLMRHLELNEIITREEMGALLSIDLKDKKFARKVVDTLNNWGYEAEKLPKKRYKIIRVPQTPEEKLNELLVRKFNMNVQINTYAFGVFIMELAENVEFAAMPWEKRVQELKEFYDIDITDRTLKSWAKRLMEAGIIAKDNNDKVEWVTVARGKEKERYTVEEFEKEYNELSIQEYKEMRMKLIKEYQQQGMSFKEAYPKAVFNDIFKGEYSKKYEGVLLYKCATLTFSAFGEVVSHEEIEEIFDLCAEIADSEPFETAVVEVFGTRLERIPVQKPEVVKVEERGWKSCDNNGEFNF